MGRADEGKLVTCSDAAIKAINLQATWTVSVVWTGAGVGRTWPRGSTRASLGAQVQVNKRDERLHYYKNRGGEGSREEKTRSYAERQQKPWKDRSPQNKEVISQ